MAPAIVTLDNTADLDDFTSTMPTTTERALLLAPASLASNESAMATILSGHDRAATDLQMLDRLAAGLIRLPVSTYDVVLILSSPSSPSSPRSSIDEATALLSRQVLASVADAMRPGARLRAHQGRLDDPTLSKEVVLAGLVLDKRTGDYTKPDYGDGGEVVSLLKRNVNKNKNTNTNTNANTNKSSAGPAAESATIQTADGHAETVMLGLPPRGNTSAPNGVVTINLDDDLDADDGDDDDIIDDNTLLTEADLTKEVNIPPECIPKAGKRRKACKDCSCGLREVLAAEEEQKRAAADAGLENIATLASDDLAEVDFTVKGKVGSCGSCALGDAFRCDGCPYIGLPAFEWGQEVKLLNNEVQL